MEKLYSFTLKIFWTFLKPPSNYIFPEITNLFNWTPFFFFHPVYLIYFYISFNIYYSITFNIYCIFFNLIFYQFEKRALHHFYWATCLGIFPRTWSCITLKRWLGTRLSIVPSQDQQLFSRFRWLSAQFTEAVSWTDSSGPFWPQKLISTQDR